MLVRREPQQFAVGHGQPPLLATPRAVDRDRDLAGIAPRRHWLVGSEQGSSYRYRRAVYEPAELAGQSFARQRVPLLVSV